MGAQAISAHGILEACLCTRRSALSAVMMVAEPGDDEALSRDSRVAVFPLGPLQTSFHAVVAGLGVASATCFSLALVRQKPFDAVLACVLLFSCWYIFTLLSERSRLEKQYVEGLSAISASLQPIATDSMPMRVTEQQGSSCTSELDLTSYARGLGVPVRGAGGLGLPSEGSTLNKILLSA